MKKILALLLVFVLSISLVACGTTGTDGKDNTGSTPAETPAETPADDEGFTVGFVISTQTNPFFVTLKDGAEAKANQLGIELIVLDSQDDSAKAAANMEDLITRGVDLILVNPTDSDAIVNSVIAANDAGIPVITVDRSSNGGEVLSYIASDNIAGGKMAGEFIIEQLGGAGKVVELEGIAGTNAARERGEGFNEAIEGTDIEVVAKQTADFDRVKGLEVMENILQSQPEIDAVFAHNDEMALGALEAIKASGRDILVVGFDATDDAVAAVEAGDMAATVAQQPELIGEMGVEAALKVLQGESIENSIPVDLKLVTK
ncbi:ribose ABC transporter substrate-binding protein RbsB [Tissierella sp. Yu-01]|uniref:ribose ABC transporter substrate-binding protein RbsB n=1 Tax=Tissierella sp. Yu-01 TaxID=3035694 RepID=UPI00240DA38F|nr:ribose ABC transporter substrate-binding protein RbsB [Tissierella sp. Yu-01]WFA10400.1 ribose ABC transporter substrate-binding protein RbsB [Tissierella sp. Yu-01]